MPSASMRPDDYTEGGGLLDNEDVVWEEVRFVMWDYDGKVPNEVPALRVTMTVKDTEEEVVQHYSAGSAADWEPSEDGRQLVSIGKARGLNKNSNVAILIKSLIDAGFPVDQIGDDCSVFEGLDCHMIRVEAPKRPGLTRAPREDGREYAPTILVVDEINELPGEKKSGGKKKKGGKAKAREKEVEEGAEDVEEKAVDAVMEVLGDESKPITKKQLAAKVHKLLKGDPDRSAVVKMVYMDEFHEDQAWDFNKKKGTVVLSY